MRKISSYDDEFDINAIPGIAGRAPAKKEFIPDAVIKRLPAYFRCLRELLNNDVSKISSAELSALMKISASQLRQDMKYFGGFGQRGYGYNVKRLYNGISEKMGVGKKYTAVIIGAGNLGTSLLQSRLLEQRGVWVKGVFDKSRSKINRAINGNTVYPVSALKDFCLRNRVEIAVLCIPVNDKKEILSVLDGCGISGIWNFCPCELYEEETGVPVINVCVGDSLMLLTYEMSLVKDKNNENQDKLL